ncbi:MAG: DUF4956 domain-containing protein [Oscillospiraceae bacterium]|jgi:uncharacterized membrane protein YhiD involved in acid resistance|nr:DUF4956 domain-containing protein [Oscillospiraceae bacterium]
MSRLLELLRETPQVESLSSEHILFTLSVAAVCGLIIYLVYRFFGRSVLYSAGFNLLNVMVCLVTAFIILTIGANLVLSLGMVGALSIVRFRAAIKDPLDVGFLFWAVAAGLTAGARLYLVALVSTAFIAAVFILFTLLRLERRTFLLIVRYGAEAEDDVTERLRRIGHKLKNKTVELTHSEITAEVRVRRGDASFVTGFREVAGVTSAVLMEYSGE